MAVSSFYLVTLGCKVNQYESHALREAWIRLGAVEAPGPEAADVLVINTCAVTARAVSDVRAAVRRLHRAAPGAPVLLAGCAAQALGAELATLPGVVKVLSQAEKADLMHALPLSGPPEEPSARAAATGSCARDGGGFSDDFSPDFPPYRVSGYNRSRAVLKIQDGCSHGCTYCIVPLARGRARSRPYAQALAEAKRLARAGFAEIVISGVNLRQYRHERGGDFWDFLAALDADLVADLAADPGTGLGNGLGTGLETGLETGLDAGPGAGPSSGPGSGPSSGPSAGLSANPSANPGAGPGSGPGMPAPRLRISSLEPGQLGPKALDVLGRCRLVAPHLHLSLQSGSPEVLRAMGRGHYEPAACIDFVRDLATVWPRFGLGADLLTGFPGESEGAFIQGTGLIKALPLTYAHVFPYSRRPGTRAATHAGQVPREEKKRRAAILRDLVRDKKRAFARALLDVAPQYVAFEGPSAAADGCGRKGRGVNEFYVECVVDREPRAPARAPAGAAAGLTAVRPVGIEGEALIVQPLQPAARPEGA